MTKISRSTTFYLIVLFSFLAFTDVVSAQEKPVLRMFSDEKNGYFSMLVPAAWRQEDFKDTRTKVAFYHPTEKDIYIKLWAREAPVDYDYAALLKDKKEWTRKANDKGIPSVVSEEKIGEFPAIVIFSKVPNAGSIEQIFFLQSGISFHLSLGGSSKQRVEKYQKLYRQVVESVIAKASFSHDPEKAKAQLLSQYIRMAELQIQLGNRELARDIAKEGLTEFPGDKNLKALAYE